METSDTLLDGWPAPCWVTKRELPQLCASNGLDAQRAVFVKSANGREDPNIDMLVSQFGVNFSEELDKKVTGRTLPKRFRGV